MIQEQEKSESSTAKLNPMIEELNKPKKANKAAKAVAQLFKR